jgi:uncharacterized protein
MTKLAPLALLAALTAASSAHAQQQRPAPDTIGGLPRHATLGVAITVDSSAPGRRGVVVQMVLPTGTAATAGVKVGDRVLALNDTAVSDVPTFVARSGRLLAGRPVALRVRRGADTLELHARAAARPFESAEGLAVDYGSVSASGVRRRTITVRPTTPGRHPAVLVMGGVGCYSLDGLREGQGGYGTLVYGLARAGYAVMRVEKVGEGDSDGPRCDSPAADLKLEVAGLAAGLRALRADPRVDSAQVAIVAHSMGPIEAALVADSIPVSALVLAETTGLSWFEYSLDNMRRQRVLLGEPYDAVEGAMRLHTQCVYRFHVLHETPQAILAAQPGCSESLALPQPYTYMQQVGDVNLAEHWKRIDRPVLVVYGTSDFVTSERDSRYLVDMINGFHPGRASLRVIEGMNHGLESAPPAREEIRRAGGPPAEVHPELLPTVRAWLDAARAASTARGG